MEVLLVSLTGEVVSPPPSSLPGPACGFKQLPSEGGMCRFDSYRDHLNIGSDTSESYGPYTRVGKWQAV